MTIRRSVPWLGALALLGALGACGPRWLWGPEVAVVEVQPRDLVRTLVVNGRVLAPRRVQIGVQPGGVVARRLVDAGARVAPGQLLLELDGAEPRAELARAEAALAELREVSRLTDRAALADAESTLQQAAWRHERNQRLVVQGIVAESQLEDSRKELESARAGLASAEAQYRSTLDGSALALAEADFAVARARLEQMQVLAPAAGVVLTRSVEVGDQVQPGTPLLTLALDGALQLLIQPDERNLAQLAIGQEAMASTDAFPDRPFPARIGYVAPSVDAARGTVDVKLDLPAPPDFLRPDMTVSVEIVLGQSRAALAVPVGALRNGASPSLLVLRAGRATSIEVALGQRGEVEVEVSAGLAPGDLVILDPAAKDGQRCRARSSAAPTAP